VQPGPLRQFYQRSLAKGIKPTMVRLTKTGVQGQDAEPASKVPPSSIPSFRGTEHTSSTQNSHIASKTRVFVLSDSQ
jgi:hypothetical protein